MNEKRAVFSGAFWKLAERLTAQVVTLIVSIILARLLSPDEYGTISLVTVFITIANVFVTNGFGTALIQKQDADSVDFSSVFYFSLVFTGCLYLILFFLATPIATFYNMPILRPVLRVLAISVPIMGINSVQQAYVSRKMDFRKFFFATIIGTSISAFVGIALAYKGFGVWALVAQTLTNNIIATVIVQLSIDWKLTREFSIYRVKRLFDYGWKLLAQSLVLQVYSSLRSILIGKIYTASDLAFYTKGKQFPDLLCSNIDTAINAALFPAMAKAQDHIEKIRNMARKTTQIISYVMSPILIGFMAVSTPFIRIVLTEKWLPCVPYLCICCVILLFRAPQTAMLQAIKAVGRSDIVLKYDFPIRIFALVVLICSIRFGVIYFALSEILTTILGTILYAIAAKKVIGYSYGQLCLDFGKNTCLALAMGVVVFLTGKLISGSDLLVLLIQIIAGSVTYLGISLVSCSNELFFLLNIIKPIVEKFWKLKGKKNKNG